MTFCLGSFEYRHFEVSVVLCRYLSGLNHAAPKHVFFIIEFPSRKIIHFAITTNPTQQWLETVLTASFPGGTPEINVMVTDRNGIYGEWLTPFLQNVLGITRKRTPPRCPFYNPFAERMLRTFRVEILDYTFIWDRTDLARILTEFIGYYNMERPHCGLDGDAPEHKFVVELFPGRHQVRKEKLLGGVITNFKLAA